MIGPKLYQVLYIHKNRHVAVEVVTYMDSSRCASKNQYNIELLMSHNSSQNTHTFLKQLRFLIIKSYLWKKQ